jgi:CheY-like chemotaxis protein
MALAHAIIIDIRLPGRNGWQATSIIKKQSGDTGTYAY